MMDIAKNEAVEKTVNFAKVGRSDPLITSNKQSIAFNSTAARQKGNPIVD